MQNRAHFSKRVHCMQQFAGVDKTKALISNVPVDLQVQYTGFVKWDTPDF